ncbi:MAG: hypothetical protein NTW96_15855, partial [Planctomycetia bacterium]|nr:hypothetical protein [Planctomycetia bacterium]
MNGRRAVAAWLTWLTNGCFPAIGLLLAGSIMGALPGQESPQPPPPPATPSSAPPAPRPPLSLDDAPEPFVPKTPPTEADADRLHALTLFSTARALEKRDEFPAALRHYERALRYDPGAKTAARQIVLLADQLHRPAERNRYLLGLAELDPEAIDPADLIDLTEDVDRQDVLRRVIAVYEKVLAARAEKKLEKSPVDVLLQWRMAEMLVLDEQYAKAAECARRVIEALKEPKQFGLDEETTKQLLSGPRPPQSLFGEYFLLADRPDQAEAAFHEADRLVPDPALLSFHLARVEARRKKPGPALTRLEASFDQGLTGRGLEPYKLLAELLDQLGKKDELVARLEKRLAKSPEDAGLGYFLAEQYRQAGQFDKARPLYVRLLAKQPSAA